MLPSCSLSISSRRGELAIIRLEGNELVSHRPGIGKGLNRPTLEGPYIFVCVGEQGRAQGLPGEVCIDLRNRSIPNVRLSFLGFFLETTGSHWTFHTRQFGEMVLAAEGQQEGS